MYDINSNKMNKTLLISSALMTYAGSIVAQNALPNIVVFVADDAGKDFGCYGVPEAETPNIDRLRGTGMLIRNAFVTSPQSSPSRISMMTGQFAHTLRCEDLATPIPDGTCMIPNYIKKNGYYTGAMLKTHWGEAGTKQFDFYFNGKSALYSQPYMTADNLFFKKYNDFLDDTKGRPFFLWVAFNDPHRPYKQEHTAAVHSMETVEVPAHYVDTERTRQDIADYLDEIHRMDQHVGFMIQELGKRKLMENTVIIFVSDNGLPFIKAKGFVYEGGIEVPMIVSWPGVVEPGSEHSNGLISLIDMAPTILDICGVEKPARMYGESLVPILRDSQSKGRGIVFAERNHHDTEEYIRCIRTEKYKLIYNAYTSRLPGIAADVAKSDSWHDLLDAKMNGTLTPIQSQYFTLPRPGIELYDLEKDPMEYDNLAYQREYQGIITELLKKLRTWQEETSDRDYWEHEKPDMVDRVTGMPLRPYKSFE